MSLFSETLCISMAMAALCGAPLFSKRLRACSKFFFLMGTGSLFGILFFDLLPDLFGLGGGKSLWAVAAVWAIYSLMHLSHLGLHKHSESETQAYAHAHPHTGIFLGSMMAHCLASGMLLVASSGLASGVSRAVFFALLAHKGYESLTVSSILIDRQRTLHHAALSILAYALSLPAGVLLSSAFRSALTPSVALLVTSLAAGTLLGCLFFDFMLPSLPHLRSQKRDIGWIALGLLCTQAVMGFV